MARLEIFIYLIGSLFFTLFCFAKMAWCFVSGNIKAATKIILQLDDAFNVALNGDADMKFSSRVYVGASLGVKKYQVIMVVLDFSFELFGDGPEHCKQSYLNDF